MKLIKDLFTELDNQTYDLKRVTFAVCTVYGLVAEAVALHKGQVVFEFRPFCESIGILVTIGAASQAVVKRFGAENTQQSLPTG